MRDGVKLHAEVWRPEGVAAGKLAATGNLPILLQRSPYGFGMERVTRSFDAEYKELAQEGFIFVLEDIRGRFGSEGEFVMLRSKAPRGGVDESTDTYDSIDWLVKSIPDNNGKVGVFGVSYLGWTTAMATVDAHPALKAGTPHFCPSAEHLVSVDRSESADVPTEYFQSGPRGLQSADSLGVSYGALPVGDCR